MTSPPRTAEDIGAGCARILSLCVVSPDEPLPTQEDISRTVDVGWFAAAVAAYALGEEGPSEDIFKDPFFYRALRAFRGDTQ